MESRSGPSSRVSYTVVNPAAMALNLGLRKRCNVYPDNKNIIT